MDKIFFDSWDSLFRTFIITILSYIALIFMLRISGKRTLTQMNAFDFVVTIALGSVFATVMLNKDVALADGVLALMLLIGLQFIITWLSARYSSVKKLVTSEPTLLVYKGRIYHKELKKQRVTIEELEEAIRRKGFSDLKTVGAVFLETAGDVTVLSSYEKDNALTD